MWYLQRNSDMAPPHKLVMCKLVRIKTAPSPSIRVGDCRIHASADDRLLYGCDVEGALSEP